MSSREVTVYASAARTATPAAIVVSSGYATGMHVVVDVTAIVTAPSITVTLEQQDVASGKWYPLLVSAAIVATGTTVLRVYPGLVAAANLVANDVLTEAVRVTVTHGNANSITYSVSAHLVQ
jgi:hypothetical protein